MTLDSNLFSLAVNSKSSLSPFSKIKPGQCLVRDVDMPFLAMVEICFCQNMKHIYHGITEFMHARIDF